MLNLARISPNTLQPGADPSNLYALQDFLEMRSGLTGEKRACFLEQLRRHLDLSEEIHPLPAFMIGKQAVLCIKDEAPASYWVYSPKQRQLRPWKEQKISPKTDTPVKLKLE